MRDPVKKKRVLNFCHQWDSSYKFVWQHYDDLVEETVQGDISWLDLGCGDNGYVAQYGPRVAFALGSDILLEAGSAHPFVQASVNRLPFRNQSFDLITLRFVVEHLVDIPAFLNEIERVLKPSGKLIFVTTNTLSPFILLARFVPFHLKQALIHKLFKVDDKDIFPTYHQLNSPGKVQSALGRTKLNVNEIKLLQEVNYLHFPLAVLFFLGHLITQPRLFRKFRTNLIVIAHKG